MFQMENVKTYEEVMVFIVLATAGLALGYALWLRNYIMSADKGTKEMQRIWGHIRDGANAYLRTQLRTVVVLIVVLTIAMFLSVFVVSPTPEANEYFDGDEDRARIVIAIARALAFVMGSSFSAMVGFFGMNMAVQGNVRVAAAAERGGYQEALKIAYRSGTITGMLTDGLGLLGGTLIFIIFGKASPDVLLGFGFGGTLLALFMRVGGVSTPRRQMLARTWLVRSKPVWKRTTRATRPSSPTWWATTWVTAPVWRRTSSSRTR